MLESSLVKYGNASIAYTIGEPHQVVFDDESVWTYYQRLPDKNPSLLHFFHVHPSGLLQYSGVDVNCIKGLNLQYGYAVNFSIVCFDSWDLNSLDHRIATYRWQDEKMIPQDNPCAVDGPLLTSTEKSALKLLSYCPESVIEITSHFKTE